MIFPRETRSFIQQKVGLKFEGRVFTFREINERVNRLANSFLQLGMQKGDRIGVLERNCSEYIELYFGPAKNGMVIVPISPRLSRDEILFLLRDSGAKALVVGTEFAEIGRSVGQEVNLGHLILLGDEGGKGFLTYEKNAFSCDP